jgi:hypothetical protein
MKLSIQTSFLLVGAIALASCQRDEPASTVQPAIETTPPPVEEIAAPATTPITEDNYALAETQVIFADYKERIAAATGTNGMGAFMHLRSAMPVDDRTVMRPNFDTLYSSVLLDLAEPATLVMPETGGRYQTAWIITEDHYNPFALTAAGEHQVTFENTGSRYVLIIVRTQANMADPSDLALAHQLQDQLDIRQADRGDFAPSQQWDMDEILMMRRQFQQMAEEKGITSETMFGRKDEVPLDNHNAGTAYGWGGFTPEQAVYPGYLPTSTEPQTLTIKNPPIADNAFWSITVYDKDGFVAAENFNINSASAMPNEDGSYAIHFGGDPTADNFLDIFPGWNFTLRLYLPTEAYFDGSWVRPELEPAG